MNDTKAEFFKKIWTLEIRILWILDNINN
jgi:hypothetical protein